MKKNGSISLLITVFGTLIGALGGAFLGAYIQQQAVVKVQSLQNLSELQRKAYEDFFRVQAANMVIDTFNSEVERNNWTKWAADIESSGIPIAKKLQELRWQYKLDIRDARLRLAVFAPQEIIEAIAEYDNLTSPNLHECSDAWEKDVQIYCQMRRLLRSDIEEDDIDPAKLYQVMFRCRPKSKN